MTKISCCFYYNRTELKKDGKAKLYFASLLETEKVMKNNYDFSAIQVMSNPSDLKIDIKKINAKFMREKILPTIEKQVQLAAKDEKTEWKNKVYLKGDILFTKEVKV